MRKRFEPGETISETSTVLNYSSNESCYPAGEYESIKQIGIGDSESEYDISFTVTLIGE
jgi:hypothetical protein